MAPFLLDRRGLFKLILLLLVMLSASFAGGFMTGYQKSSMQQSEFAESHIIVLPNQELTELDSELQQLPTVPPQGAEIDVDGPDPEANEIALVEKVVKLQPIESQKIESKNEKQTAIIEKTVIVKDKVTVAIPSVKIEDLKTRESNLEAAKYSIQVGMYGREANANNRVILLQAQGMDAYLSEYVNKKKQVRYNVRFGYYPDKKGALTALKTYQATYEGSGYLVRFKLRDSIKNVTMNTR